MKVDKAKFRKPVLPGDQLKMEITLKKKIKAMFGNFLERHYVSDNNLVAEASITAMVVRAR